MMEDVKARRRYESPRRREQAAQTRRDVIAAAGVLFRDRGYAGVAMPDIASSAGVAVETIYRAFGGKAALFKAVVESAVAGGAARADTPVEDRPAIRALIEERDARKQVALYAATQPGIHRRSGPLLRALRDAAAVDPELRTLWRDLENQRLHGQGRFAGLLGERGALRPGMSVEDARDIVWTLCSVAVHELLVIERGWSSDRYEAWLATSLIAALLPDDDHRAATGSMPS
jgi:AcrR family transcriptional regulator